MKIIFVNRYFYPDFSATSQILYDLAKALARNGFKIENFINNSFDLIKMKKLSYKLFGLNPLDIRDLNIII